MYSQRCWMVLRNLTQVEKHPMASDSLLILMQPLRGWRILYSKTRVIHKLSSPNLFTSSFWFFLLSPTTIQCLSDRIDVAYNVGPLLILFSFLRLNEGRYRFPRYPLPTYAFISRLNASKTNICLRNMPPLLQLFEAQHGADFFMACSISASWSASRAS